MAFGIDGDDDGLRAETFGNVRDQSGIGEGGGVDADLVGAR